VRPLLKDIAYLRRARRDVRARLYAQWDAEGTWRPKTWQRWAIWGGAVLGVYLLISGDKVERILGIGFVVPPAVIMAITAWTYCKALRLLRREGRREREADGRLGGGSAAGSSNDD
jgi:hypothetical protein